MKANLFKKLISFTLSAAMLTSFAAVDTYAAVTEENITWGYEESFDNKPAAWADSMYVTYSKKPVFNGTNGYLESGTEITVNKFPQTSLKVSMDIVTKGFAWVKFYYDDTNGMGEWVTTPSDETESTTHHIVLDYTPTEEDTGRTSFKIKHAGAVESIDNIKIYLDGKSLSPKAAFSFDADDYTTGDRVFTNDVVTLAKPNILNNGTHNYLENQIIKINRYPETKMLIKTELEGSGWTQVYAYDADGGNSKLLMNDGHDSEGNVSYSKLITPSADDTAEYAYLNLQWADTRQLRRLEIYVDNEENEKFSWGFTEDFEDCTVGQKPEGSYYVEFDTAVAEASGNKYQNGKGWIKVNKFPKKKCIVEMDITAKNFTWVQLYSGNNAAMGSRYNISDTDDTTHHVVLEYIPTGDTSTETYFNIANDGAVQKIDNVKIYVDGVNLNPAPSYVMDLTKYDAGEVITGTDWLTVNNGTVKENAEGYKYISNGASSLLKVTRLPDTFMTIEAELVKIGTQEAYVQIQANNGNDWLGNPVNYDGGNNAQQRVYKWTLDSATTATANNVTTQLLGAETKATTTLNIIFNAEVRSIKIWYDGIEAEPETWEGLTSYTYMNDFETEAVDTIPTSNIMSFGSSTVTEANGNRELKGNNANQNQLFLKQIPEKNFVFSCDIRLLAEDTTEAPCKEQLQLYFNRSAGESIFITQMYDALVSDTAAHSFVVIGDMTSQSLQVYVDGVQKNVTVKNADQWAAAAAAGTLTQMQFNLVNLYVDNLKVDVDTEKLYAGGFFTDADGAKMSTLVSNTVVKGRIYGASYLRENNNAQLITALYEIKSDNTPLLLKHAVTDINANRSGKCYSGDSFEVGTLAADKTYCLKQFIWDNIDDMNPLTLVAEVYTAAGTDVAE